MKVTTSLFCDSRKPSPFNFCFSSILEDHIRRKINRKRKGFFLYVKSVLLFFLFAKNRIGRARQTKK